MSYKIINFDITDKEKLPDPSVEIKSIMKNKIKGILSWMKLCLKHYFYNTFITEEENKGFKV